MRGVCARVHAQVLRLRSLSLAMLDAAPRRRGRIIGQGKRGYDWNGFCTLFQVTSATSRRGARRNVPLSSAGIWARVAAVSTAWRWFRVYSAKQRGSDVRAWCVLSKALLAVGLDVTSFFGRVEPRIGVLSNKCVLVLLALPRINEERESAGGKHSDSDSHCRDQFNDLVARRKTTPKQRQVMPGTARQHRSRRLK